MPLEQQKRWIIFITSHNIQISQLTEITKLMPVINEPSVSIYLSMPRTKTNLVRGSTIKVRSLLNDPQNSYYPCNVIKI